MVEKASASNFPGDAAVADGSEGVLCRETWLESGAFQNAILTSAKLAVIVTDTNGIVRLFNVGAERMLGYSAVEVVNRITLIDIHDPQELVSRASSVSRELSTPIAPDFEALICKASSGAEDYYESVLIRKNRERVPVALSITVLGDGRDRISGYLLLVTEISVRANAAFEPCVAPSLAGPADLSQLDSLARMSHEMRTPLSAIVGFAQLMESGNPSPTISQKRNIDHILKAGWYLDKLINMTRDLALIESGTLSLSLESLALAEVMPDCQAIWEPQAQIRGVRLVFPLFDSPCVASADRLRLHQVLDTLLSAAIEYSDVGGAVVVSCERHSQDGIRIGITAGTENLPPGRRRQRSAPLDGFDREAAPLEGTGIGLLLARRLVELMGGAIVAESSDCTRKVFAFDLKCIHIPTAAGRTSTFSYASETSAATAITR